MLVTTPAAVVALPVWLQANAGSGFLTYSSRSARAHGMKAGQARPRRTAAQCQERTQQNSGAVRSQPALLFGIEAGTAKIDRHRRIDS